MSATSTILVVDDSRESLRLMRETLEREGFAVRLADGGDLALASIAAAPPDLVLLDLRMPGMDGFQVLRQRMLQDPERRVPVIVMSGEAQPEERVEAMALGAVDFITKPFHEEELLVRLRTHLELSRTRTELARRGAELQALYTRLKQESAEKLQESEHLLQETGRMARVGGWELELTTMALTWSAVTKEIHEVPPDYVPTLAEGIHFYAPEALPVIEACVQRAIEFGEPYDEELPFITAKGRRIWVRAMGQAHVRQGVVHKLSGMFQDITDAKRTALALADHQEHLEKLVAERTSALQIAEATTEQHLAVVEGILESTGEPIFSLDRTYCYTSFNRAHAAVMKALYGRDIQVGACILDYQAVAEDRAAAKANLDRALSGEAFTEAGMSGELGLSWRYFEVTHTPIREANGAITGVAVFAHDTTANRQAMAAQQAAERRTHTMLQTTHDGVWLIGPGGEIEDLNEAASLMVGYSREEMLAMTINDLEARETGDQVQLHIAQIFEKGGDLFETVHRRKDGTLFPVEISVKVIQATREQVAFIRDITQRKQAEETLQRTADLLQQVERLAGIGGWEVDLETMQQFWTAETFRIHELDPATGTPAVASGIEFYAPEWRAVIALAFQEAMETGQGYDLELEILTATGRRLWVRTISHCIWKEGKVVRILGAFQDISERMRFQQQIQENEAFVTSVLDSLSSHVAVLDARGVILSTNQAWEDFSLANGGDPAHTGVGLNYLAACESAVGTESETAQQIATAIRQVLAGTLDAFELEYPCHSPREQRWFVARVSRMIGGDLPRVVITHASITARKLAQLALSASEQRLRGILDNMQDVYFRADREGKFTFMSPSASGVYGYDSVEEMLGLPATALYFNPEARQELLEALKETGATQDFVDQARRKDGSGFWVSMNAQFVRDEQGQVIGTEGVVRDIDQRMRTEEAMRESERRHRTVFETSADGLALVDRESLVFLDANPAFCAMYGYSLAELLTLNATDVSAEPAATARATRSGSNYVGHRWHRRKDGSVFPVELVAQGFEEAGRIVNVVSSRDITERLKEEEALQLRVDQLQIMLDLSALPETHAGKDLLQEGLALAARLSRSEVGFLHLLTEAGDALALSTWTGPALPGGPDAPEGPNPWPLAGVWREAVQQKRAVVRNDLATSANSQDAPAGPLGLLRELIVPVVEAGQVRMLLGVGNKAWSYDDLDIGQLEVAAQDLWKGYAHQQLELELAASETSLKAAFDQAMVGMAHFTLAGELLRTNERFRQILGLSPSDLVGLDLDTLSHPEDMLSQDVSLGDILKGLGGNLSIEKRFIRPDGQYVWVQLFETVVDPGSGRSPYVLRILEDISERKGLESELQAMNRGLERRVAQRTQQFQAVNQELEAFAYSVSHDLRAPLRAISGFSEALVNDRGSSFSPEGADYLERIKRGSLRMGQLIEDMLHLSRIGRDDFAILPLDLSALAEQILTRLREAEPERQVDCQVEGPIRVLGDPRLLRILLENLLGNAWKFTTHTRPARIKMSATALGSAEIEIVIADNGAGFSPAQAGKLFTPFQRLHKESEFPGTGIGLAIAKRILQRHGGEISAQGAVGQGAVVRFTLQAPKEAM